MDKKHELRRRRHYRLRRRVVGTPERPRLAIFRSLKHIYAQVIDDTEAKTLEIQGVGYRAALAGKKLTMSVGYSHGIEVIPKDGITFEVGQETNTRNFFVKITGIDKEVVGQQAAEIRAVKKPEPYKGKGIRYQGELVRRKAGKTAKGGKGK